MEAENSALQANAPQVNAPGEEAQKKNAEKSFITTAGWVMIGYGVLQAFSAALSHFFIQFMMKLWVNSAPYSDAREVIETMDLLVRMLPAMVIYSAVLSIVLVVTGTAVLKRRNWGRLLAIVILGVMIIGGVTGLVVGGIFMWQIASHVGASAYPGIVGGAVGGLVGGLPWLGLYGYVIYKLTRPEIRAEFNT